MNNASSYTQVIAIGDLQVKSIVYAPWLGSIRSILKDAGLGWTERLLIADVDVDFTKGRARITFAALGERPGESVFDVIITLTPDK